MCEQSIIELAKMRLERENTEETTSESSSSSSDSPNSSKNTRQSQEGEETRQAADEVGKPSATTPRTNPPSLCDASEEGRGSPGDGGVEKGAKNATKNGRGTTECETDSITVITTDGTTEVIIDEGNNTQSRTDERTPFANPTTLELAFQAEWTGTIDGDRRVGNKPSGDDGQGDERRVPAVKEMPDVLEQLDQSTLVGDRKSTNLEEKHYPDKQLIVAVADGIDGCATHVHATETGSRTEEETRHLDVVPKRRATKNVSGLTEKEGRSDVATAHTALDSGKELRNAKCAIVAKKRGLSAEGGSTSTTAAQEAISSGVDSWEKGGGAHEIVHIADEGHIVMAEPAGTSVNVVVDTAQGRKIVPEVAVNGGSGVFTIDEHKRASRSDHGVCPASHGNGDTSCTRGCDGSTSDDNCKGKSPTSRTLRKSMATNDRGDLFPAYLIHRESHPYIEGVLHGDSREEARLVAEVSVAADGQSPAPQIGDDKHTTSSSTPVCFLDHLDREGSHYQTSIVTAQSVAREKLVRRSLEGGNQVNSRNSESSPFFYP